MSDKSVILKNIDGDKIFPIIPYTNIIGAPHPLNSDVTIFYGTGVPVNTKSTYENIKEDDLYIDRDNTYGIGIYRCGLTTDTTVVWRGLSNGVYYPDDPITETTPWLARFQITPNIGLIYVNSNTGDIFILTGKQVPNLTWTKVTGGNSTNIFYGNGVPTSTKSDYENIKLDDLYIDRNKTYALCIYRCAAIPNPEVVIWQSTESDIKDVGEPPTTFTEVNNKYKIFLKVGITYTDTRYGDVYILTEINNLVLTWTKVGSKQSWETINTITLDHGTSSTYWQNIFDNSNNVYKKIRVSIYMSFTESVSLSDTQGGWVIGVDSSWKYYSTVIPNGTASTNHYLAEAIIDFENHTITQFVQKGYVMATNTEMFINSLADKKGFIQIYSLYPAVIDSGTITIEGIKY